MRLRLEVGGGKVCVLKKKELNIDSLVPPYSFSVWDHSLLFCQLR